MSLINSTILIPKNCFVGSMAIHKEKPKKAKTYENID